METFQVLIFVLTPLSPSLLSNFWGRDSTAKILYNAYQKFFNNARFSDALVIWRVRKWVCLRRCSASEWRRVVVRVITFIGGKSADCGKAGGRRGRWGWWRVPSTAHDWPHEGGWCRVTWRVVIVWVVLTYKILHHCKNWFPRQRYPKTHLDFWSWNQTWSCSWLLAAGNDSTEDRRTLLVFKS